MEPMPETVLCLRTCAADMTSHNGFRWPESGPVEAPDWSPEPECGHGLHGFLWGEGDGSLANWKSDARWLVVAVDPATVIDLQGKVKFPNADVVHCGDRLSATTYLAEHGGLGRAIIGSTVSGTGGDGSTVSGTGGFGSTVSGTGGFGSTVSGTGGDGSTVSGTGGFGSTVSGTGGFGSTVSGTGGDRSTVSGTGGDGSTVSGTGGDRSTVSGTGGDRSTVSGTGGDGSTVSGTGGDRSTVSGTGGDRSTVSGTGGDGSTVSGTGGDRSTVSGTGGDRSTIELSAGERGTLIVTWWDDSFGRYRVATGYIGEDGLKPNVPYRCERGKWIEVDVKEAATAAGSH